MAASRPAVTSSGAWRARYSRRAALYTSLRDYARYAALNLMAYPPRDDAEVLPVRRSTLREMHTAQRWARPQPPDMPVARRSADPNAPLWLAAANYGFGWMNVTSCSEPRRLQHGGYEPGYFASVILLPRERLGFVVLAASAPVGFRSYSGPFALLREAGVLRAPASPPPARELVSAASTVASLLDHYDAAAVARTFDAQTLRYTWFQHLEGDFAELRTKHGRCTSDTSMSTYTALHGSTHLACERGNIGFEILLTPTRPAKVQALIMHETFPAAATTEAVAARLVRLLNSWNDAAATDLFVATASAAEREGYRTTLAHFALDHGSCKLERGLRELVHQPFGVQERTHFKLRCAKLPETSLDLSVFLNEASGRVAGFDLHRDVPDDAVCAP